MLTTELSGKGIAKKTNLLPNGDLEKIYMVHFKVQSEVNPEQAWTPTGKGHKTINSATMLGAIGEFPN